MKKTVVFDFDGVIHSYTSGWKGQSVISDPPVPGIKEAIAEIRSAGYEVVVVSTRCASLMGHGSVSAWLHDHGIEVDGVMMEKPPAIVYIDDRAICFDGKPEGLLEKIEGFDPWYKKSHMTNADRIRAMSDEELAEWYAGVVVLSGAAIETHFGVEYDEKELRESIKDCAHEFLQELKAPVAD